MDPDTGRPLIARSAPNSSASLNQLGGSTDDELRALPNPFRGRQSPSLTPGVHGYLRYHTADQVINEVAGAPSDFIDNPYLDVGNTDEFPSELLDFVPPNIIGQAFSGLIDTRDGLLGDFTLPIPFGAEFTPLTNTVILTDNESIRNAVFGATEPFGGDYSGTTRCVAPGGLQEFEQLAGTTAFPGCLPLQNIRAIGGMGELPLRPTPDLGTRSVNPGLIAQGLFIPRASGASGIGSCQTAAVGNSRDLSSVTPAGIGTDLDCLKPGLPFESSPQNALEHHHANQQLFAQLCSDTIGSSVIDPSACAFTLLNSALPLNSAIAIPSSELVSTLAAGEFQANNFHLFIAGALSSAGSLGRFAPTQGLNRDANDGFIGALSGTFMRCFVGPFETGADPHCGGGAVANGGINQLPVAEDGNLTGNLVAKLLPSRPDFLTLDSTLSNEQRALLGCGPFWGTRCDSAASMADFDCDDFDLLPNPNIPPDSPFLANSGCQNQNGNLFVTDAFGGIVIETSGYEFRNELWSPVFPGSLQRGGGIDLLNADPVIFSAFPVLVPAGYITTSTFSAPGTVNGLFSPFCEGPLGVLPGCRGIASYALPADPNDSSPIFFTFDEGYNPSVDGCLLAPMIGNHQVRTLDSDGNDFTGSPEMMSCFGQLAPTSGDFDPDHPLATNEDTLQDSELNPCSAFLVRDQPGADFATCEAQIARFLDKSNTDSIRGNYQDSVRGASYLRNRNGGVDPAGDPFLARIRGASTLYHPLAGCLTGAEIELVDSFLPEGPICNARPIFSQNVVSEQEFININSNFAPDQPFAQATLDAFGSAQTPRDYDAEFLNGTAQIFKNEIAAVSWNLAISLVVGSGCSDSDETNANPACFNTKQPYALDRCSFSKPQDCREIQSALAYTNVPEPASTSLAIGALLTIAALARRRAVRQA